MAVIFMVAILSTDFIKVIVRTTLLLWQEALEDMQGPGLFWYDLLQN